MNTTAIYTNYMEQAILTAIMKQFEWSRGIRTLNWSVNEFTQGSQLDLMSTFLIQPDMEEEKAFIRDSTRHLELPLQFLEDKPPNRPVASLLHNVVYSLEGWPAIYRLVKNTFPMGIITRNGSIFAYFSTMYSEEKSRTGDDFISLIDGDLPRSIGHHVLIEMSIQKCFITYCFKGHTSLVNHQVADFRLKKFTPNDEGGFFYTGPQDKNLNLIYYPPSTAVPQITPRTLAKFQVFKGRNYAMSGPRKTNRSDRIDRNCEVHSFNSLCEEKGDSPTQLPFDLKASSKPSENKQRRRRLTLDDLEESKSPTPTEPLPKTLNPPAPPKKKETVVWRPEPPKSDSKTALKTFEKLVSQSDKIEAKIKEEKAAKERHDEIESHSTFLEMTTPTTIQLPIMAGNVVPMKRLVKAPLVAQALKEAMNGTKENRLRIVASIMEYDAKPHSRENTLTMLSVRALGSDETAKLARRILNEAGYHSNGLNSFVENLNMARSYVSLIWEELVEKFGSTSPRIISSKEYEACYLMLKGKYFEMISQHEPNHIKDYLDTERTNFYKVVVEKDSMGNEIAVRSKVAVVPTYMGTMSIHGNDPQLCEILRLTDLTGVETSTIIDAINGMALSTCTSYVGSGDVFGLVFRLNEVFKVVKFRDLNYIHQSMDLSYSMSYWTEFMDFREPHRAPFMDRLTKDGRTLPFSQWDLSLATKNPIELKVEDEGRIGVFRNEDGTYYTLTYDIPYNPLNLQSDAGPGYGNEKKRTVYHLAVQEAETAFEIISNGGTITDILAVYPFFAFANIKPKMEVQDLREPLDGSFFLHNSGITEGEMRTFLTKNLYQEKVRAICVVCFAAVIHLLYIASLITNMKLFVVDGYLSGQDTRLLSNLIPLAGWNQTKGNFDLIIRRFQRLAPFDTINSEDECLAVYSDNVTAVGSLEDELDLKDLLEFQKEMPPIHYSGLVNSAAKTAISLERRVPAGTRVLVSLDGSKQEAASSYQDVANLLSTMLYVNGVNEDLTNYLNQVTIRACHSSKGLLGNKVIDLDFQSTGSPLTFLVNDKKSYSFCKHYLSNKNSRMDMIELIRTAKTFGVKLKVESITVLPPLGEQLTLNMNQPLDIDLLGFGVVAIPTKKVDGQSVELTYMPVLQGKRLDKSMVFAKGEGRDFNRVENFASKCLSQSYNGAILLDFYKKIIVEGIIEGRKLFSKVEEFEVELGETLVTEEKIDASMIRTILSKYRPGDPNSKREVS